MGPTAAWTAPDLCGIAAPFEHLGVHTGDCRRIRQHRTPARRSPRQPDTARDTGLPHPRQECGCIVRSRCSHTFCRRISHRIRRVRAYHTRAAPLPSLTSQTLVPHPCLFLSHTLGASLSTSLPLSGAIAHLSRT
eukprot:3363613-Rhodomonas_salina.2